ncbi:prephenate dehydrogenase/arogenate dehydrogenase family protein [Streptomyces sp. I6]|uniref:prephenate dehydrogenase/arogenate dehydrogenase family protein n=1 Tax=Streptomyces sp. I6 TaxID=2483113 RepID=UPI0028803021|nr:prephenate dehydrogenase/arogenate dehydrogenase family protein [Streptomyces sp. I6]
MIRRCVVVGGAGAVGRLFAERLLAGGARVAVADTVEPGGEPAGTHYVRGDVTAPGARLEADLGHADLVVLAVPDAVALAAVPGLARVLRPDALLVDTLSVKQPVTAALRAHAPAVQAVGLNPMFAPALGFEGRPVAAVVVNDGPRVGALLELVGSWGARVVPMDAAEHDRLAGASQALTHAAVLGFGLALTRLGPDMGRIREIAPPRTTRCSPSWPGSAPAHPPSTGTSRPPTRRRRRCAGNSPRGCASWPIWWSTAPSRTSPPSSAGSGANWASTPRTTATCARGCSRPSDKEDAPHGNVRRDRPDAEAA